MDTYNTLSADADPAVLTAAVQRLNELERVFSRNREDATLYQLNEAGAAETATLPLELQELLKQSQLLCEETKGAFDPTLGVLVDLWDVRAEQPSVPQEAEIVEARKHCGIETLSLDDKQVILQDGMQLDLGAIAKGYVTDLLVEQLRADGVKHALLSLGGNVYALGDKNGKPFQIGLADPKNPSKLLGKLLLQNRAVVTSGDYQRYFEADGKRYHHIVDPKTGHPADSGLAAVTVVAQSALLADAYSTALFVMGQEEGLRLVEADERLEAVFVTRDGTVTCSSGLQETFVP